MQPPQRRWLHLLRRSCAIRMPPSPSSAQATSPARTAARLPARARPAQGLRRHPALRCPHRPLHHQDRRCRHLHPARHRLPARSRMAIRCHRLGLAACQGSSRRPSDRQATACTSACRTVRATTRPARRPRTERAIQSAQSLLPEPFRRSTARWAAEGLCVTVTPHCHHSLHYATSQDDARR